MKTKITSLVAVLLVTGVLLLAFNSFDAAEPARTKPATPVQFTAEGQLLRPRDYRSWVYVGTPLTPNDMNEGAAAFPEFHSVYIDPGSYQEYLQTGRWREGTVMIKELISVGAKESSSGKGYFMGEFLGLEASIKSKDRFPNEPGNWAYFSFTSLNGEPPKPQVARSLTAACNACHGETARDDYVFTQHYPILRAAKGAGHYPENR